MRTSVIKYPLLLLFALLFSARAMPVFSQNMAANWIFGNNNGLSFTQLPPTLIINPKINTLEGCSAISDGNGALLFYSNGVRAYNRKYLTMENGENLGGDLSSTCNSVIIPVPDHDSLYYIFTVSAVISEDRSLSYAVVNMNAANGLGAVIEKNVRVTSPAFEKLSAVRHCNKRDSWIIVKVPNSSQYRSYLITPAGVNPAPVVSNVGLFVPGEENNAIGSMKFSADGKRLIVLHSQINKAELLNFDDATGVLTDAASFTPIDVTPSVAFRGTYGTEFSPDGKKLYISCNINAVEASVLYQFDLSTVTAPAIVGSRTTILSRRNFYSGGLQLGIDKKIYYTEWENLALSVIEDPDLAGTDCNLATDKIALPQPTESGLPSFISSDVISRYAGYAFSAQKPGDCSDRNIVFAINYTADIDSVKWDFGDGQKSTSLSPSHSYAAFQTYYVQLVIYRTDCSGSHTIRLGQRVSFRNSSMKLPPDISLCEPKDIVLRSPDEYETYLWNTGATTDSIVVSDPGLYWLQTEASGCVVRDTIMIIKKPAIRFHLTNDTTVCTNQTVTLFAPPNGTDYVWSDGSSGTALTVSKPGDYFLKFNDPDNCMISDTTHIDPGNCDVYFPTAFSPNNDGKNDEFGLINPTYAKPYELVVFNRWGELMFRTTDQLQRWNGFSKNKQQPVGVYTWIMKYKNKRGILQSAKGSVLLIR